MSQKQVAYISISIYVHLNIRRFLREACVLNFINLKRFKNPPKRS